MTISPVFEAAGTGRRVRSWSPSGSGPVRAVEYNLQTLRNRVRDAIRNDSVAAAIVRTWVVGLIGSGIVCRSTDTDPERKARIESAWNEWIPFASMDGFDFYALQTQAASAFIASGECFLRVLHLKSDCGLPVPVQFQLIESDQLPFLDRDLGNGNRIIQGIEFDAMGRRCAYWMYRNHPGEGMVGFNDLVRIPADQVSHIFNPERPGQLRGVPMMAPVLAKLRGVGDFDDAVLERQKIANLFTGFVERPPSTGEARLDPLTGQPIITDPSGVPMVGMEPGTMQELLPGESVKFSEPPDAGAGYADFMRQQYLAIAGGVGLPYELLTGDLSEVSDRTLRVRLNQWLRHTDQLQWQIIIPKVCAFVRRGWAGAAFLSGALSSRQDFQAAKAVEWSPPRHRHIQPVQDVQALRAEVAAGFRSRASVISEYGLDGMTVDAERAADLQREAEMGLRPDAAILAEAEAEKLLAEAEAARQKAEQAAQEAKTAKEAAAEAKAHAEKLRSERLTLDATRALDIQAAECRANVARLEVEAAKVGLAELKGGAL